MADLWRSSLLHIQYLSLRLALTWWNLRYSDTLPPSPDPLLQGSLELINGSKEVDYPAELPGEGVAPLSYLWPTPASWASIPVTKMSSSLKNLSPLAWKAWREEDELAGTCSRRRPTPAAIR